MDPCPSFLSGSLPPASPSGPSSTMQPERSYKCMSPITLTVLFKNCPTIFTVKTELFGLIICNLPPISFQLFMLATPKSLQFPEGPRMSCPTRLPICHSFYLECPLLIYLPHSHSSKLSWNNSSSRKPAFFPISPTPAERDAFSLVLPWHAWVHIAPISSIPKQQFRTFVVMPYLHESVKALKEGIILFIFRAQHKLQQTVYAQ